MGIGKSPTFFCKPVNVGGEDVPGHRPVAARVCIAKIINENDDDIGVAGAGFAGSLQ